MESKDTRAIGAPGVRGPTDARAVPRFAGPSTFFRLPHVDEVRGFDLAVVGIPFDGGTSYRPGARFGPSAVRQASRLLRVTYHPELDLSPFQVLQVVDAGDIACNPFDIQETLRQVEDGAAQLLGSGPGGWWPSGATIPSRSRS